MDSKSFIDIANKTLSIIKENKGRSFEIPEMESFLNKLGIYSFKGSSKKKEDIKMEIQDLIIDRSDIFTFSIKSELGSKATLLNASKSTNFTFKIEGISKEDMERLNNINKEVNKKWLKTKFNEIFNNFKLGNYSISLVEDKNNTFYNNLKLIDSNLPKLLSYILFYYYSHETTSNISDLTKKLIKYNPLNLNKEEAKLFYKKKISEFIESITFGMMPNTKWNGIYEISGGLLTVKKNGEILCHHLFYDNESLKSYLFNNTKLETPSTSRHEYGQICEENNKFFFKLNLQIRLK